MSFDFDVRHSKIINGVIKFTPSSFSDSRGKLWTSYSYDLFQSFLPSNLFFNHDKFAETNINVLRGIHYDPKTWKLVTCVHGKITQVAVDMRKDSASYLKWQKYEIDSQKPTLILLPPNIGNAFYVESNVATYHYKLAYDGSYSDAEDQETIYWNDRRLGIDWGIENPILSERDTPK